MFRILLILSWLTGDCAALAILHHPVSVNKTIGGFAHFNCSIDGVILIWLINGSSIDSVVHTGKDYSQDTSFNGSSVFSSLKVPCEQSDNNTVVECVAYGGGYTDTSEAAILLLQGLVDEVSDLRVTNRTENVLKFEWSASYTLFGVPILGYELFIQTVTLKDQTTTTLQNGTILEMEVVATRKVIDGYCAFVNFTIAAINMAGLGSASSTAEYFAIDEHAGEWSAAVNSTRLTPLTRRVNALLKTSMVPCNSSLPTFLLLNITESALNTIVTCNASSIVEAESQDSENVVVIQAFFYCQILSHTVYSGSLYLYSDDFNEDLLGEVTGLTLRTFTTVNVSLHVNASLAQMCFYCELVNEIDTVGCYVVASKHGNINKMVSIKLVALVGNSFANDCLHDLPGGIYEVMVFDLDTNGMESASSSFTYHNISITGRGEEAFTNYISPPSDSIIKSTASLPSKSASPSSKVTVSDNMIWIILSSAITVLATLIVIIVFLSLTLFASHRRVRKSKKSKPPTNTDIAVSNNEAYATVIPQMPSSSRPKSSLAPEGVENLNIELKPCEAYEAVTYEIIPDFKTD